MVEDAEQPLGLEALVITDALADQFDPPLRPVSGQADAGSRATTTELAARLNVSPPAASQHTATLRAAGLISTTRQGQRVIHTVTSLGTDLLNANHG
ncbi:helix-turn-helix transcriptional regulator [Streptomyces bryophytorum]|nr:helix-turn-helix transcriptional regulator [Actinacidiphila bryophytorum]MBN6544165.1 helix-turn-helix transcriptional regulator [Actinacidiphila bryophytorum]